MSCPSASGQLPEVNWVCHSPSPYNDFLFRALSVSRHFTLKVHYMRTTSGRDYWTRPADRGYAHRFMTSPLDTALLRCVLGRRNSMLLTSCWQDHTSQLAILASIAGCRPYFIWNDTPSPHRRPWPKAHLRSAFLRVALRNASAVLGTGNVALRRLEDMGARCARLVNFPYSIDLNQFRPKAASNDTTAIVLGSSVRLDPIKGLDVAFQALAALRKQGLRLRYRIAGAGVQERELRDLAQGLGIGNEVEFVGWLQESELPAFYQSLDAYLHPARFEPYGVAVIQALATGLPVLASDQTMAAVDRVRDGVEGYLHPAGDSRALMATIQRLAAMDSAHRQQMAAVCRCAAESWTVDSAVRAVEVMVADATATRQKNSRTTEARVA